MMAQVQRFAGRQFAPLIFAFPRCFRMVLIGSSEFAPLGFALEDFATGHVHTKL